MGPQRRLLPRQAGLIAALLLAVACSSGDDDDTAAAPEPCSTVEPGNERVDLVDRWYLRNVPPAHDGTTAVPLVVDLHGYSEGATLHASRTGWEAFGDTEGFVTVTPHAENLGGDVPAWDLAADGADVAFVDDVIDDAERTLCIDPQRIYVTGHSMGAFLASTLACTGMAERIAAFAPVAGAREVTPCTPPRHAPALIIHGTADATVLYEGGLSPGAAEILRLPADGPSIPAIAEAWSARDPSVDVELHPIEGGNHDYAVDTNDLIWTYFEAHSLD